jgi:Flp pilus assembly protein TadG
MMNKKGQAVVEFALILIIVVVLIGGFLKLWEWSVDSIRGRRGAYEGSRVVAGSEDSPGGAPIGLGGSAPDPYYLK